MASGFNINMWESQETLVKGSPAKMGVMCEHWLVFEVHQQTKKIFSTALHQHKKCISGYCCLPISSGQPVILL